MQAFTIDHDSAGHLDDAVRDAVVAADAGEQSLERSLDPLLMLLSRMHPYALDSSDSAMVLVVDRSDDGGQQTRVLCVAGLTRRVATQAFEPFRLVIPPTAPIGTEVSIGDPFYARRVGSEVTRAVCAFFDRHPDGHDWMQCWRRTPTRWMIER